MQLGIPLTLAARAACWLMFNLNVHQDPQVLFCKAAFQLHIIILCTYEKLLKGNHIYAISRNKKQKPESCVAASTSSEWFCLYANDPQMSLLVWTGLRGKIYMPYIYQYSHLLAIHVCCVKDYHFLLQEVKSLLLQNKVFKELTKTAPPHQKKD